jgi:hypothetical protein
MGEVNEDKCRMVESYFAQYGWKFSRNEEMGVWQTGFRGDVASFSISVRITEWWIYFLVNPFVVGPKNQDYRLRLYTHILRLNQDLNVAKFYLNSDYDVVLTVELPYGSAQALQYGEFEDALNLMCHYCDEYYLEVLKLATEPNAPSRYLDMQDDVDLD